MHPDPLGLPGRLPFGAAVGVPADQLLVLGIHAHYRLAGGQMGADCSFT